MDKIKKTQLFIVVLVLLIVLIFIFIKSHTIESVSINDINGYINKSPYTLVYYGDINKDINKQLKSLKKEYSMKIYKSNDSLDAIKEYISNNNDELKGEVVYFIYDKDGLKGIIDEDEIPYLTEYIDKYISGTIPTPERKYAVSTADQYIKMFKSSDKTIAVFGTKACTYCTMLERVINDISKDNKYTIYYYSRDRMSEKDYEKIMDLDLTIPASCTSDNVETSFKRGFAKPMTVVTQNGKLIGCIKGYYDKDTYLNKLKEIME